MSFLILTVMSRTLCCLIGFFALAALSYANQDAVQKKDENKAVSTLAAAKPSRHKDRPAKKILLDIKAGENDSTLIVKANDSIKLMLMRMCGLSGGEADNFVPSVQKKNKMLTVNRLFVGQKIVLPNLKCQPSGTAVEAEKAEAPSIAEKPTTNAPIAAETSPVVDNESKTTEKTEIPATDENQHVIGDRVALTELAWNHFRNDRYEEAYRYFSELNRIEPGQVDHVTGMIYALSGMKEVEKAMELAPAVNLFFYKLFPDP
jgi:hypothetical protein